jgi:undecaprenyl-diphosphatase
MHAIAVRFISLDAAEVAVVARVVAASERHGLQRIAQTATRLGNGSLYPIVTLLLIAARIEDALRFTASAALSLLLAFAVYPTLKRFLARMRPCDYDPSLARHPEPLDHYSCPSGHAMTAAAYAVPLMIAAPSAAPLALAICAIVSWSRVALGHHYVSDVIAGTLLGAGVAGVVGVVVF